MNSGKEPLAAQRHEEKINCTQCDAVCCRLEVMLISDTAVPDEYIKTDKWGGMTMARADSGWCVALDEELNRCSIYEQRPWICREYQMGGEECISEREQYLQSRS